MKGITALALLLLSLLIATGCASTRHAGDPRASVVGPCHLDFIDGIPRDRDTQLYYPSFAARGLGNWTDPTSTLPAMQARPDVVALTTELPPISGDAEEVAGEGFPSLEDAGLRLFTKGSESFDQVKWPEIRPAKTPE